jgi:hypothetical protein
MTAHVCPECSLLHDTPTATEAPEVAIARIQAENALAIARLQARAGLQAVEVEAEAAEDIAETEAGAAVAGAVLEGEIIAAEGGGEAAPDLGEPIVIEAPAPEAEPEPATEEPPVVETTTPKGKKSGGYWSAYR